MSRKMLINAQHAEQLRVAIIDGQNLEEYQVDLAQSGLCRGNIYRGVVANVQPSLNAAFVDIGLDKHGFLPVDDVLASAYHRRPGSGVKRPRIDQVLERGKPILVQVTKDGAGQKGPALTTNLAMAGRYLVFMPFDDIRGISRKVDDDVIRKKVKERLKRLDLPAGQGVIVRTNGLDQNQTTLNRDLNALLRLWKRIDAENDKGRSKEPRLLYSDQDLIVQALRDYLDNSIAEVIADTDAAYDQADSYMRAFMPRSKTELVRYTERLPLFSKYEIEQQIDRIYSRQVSLPGGGSIVIDGTEALTAIDVNSGRATKNNDHEESILRVNCEAAHEIGRQLRLRDIGGLLVVDFIDMRMRKHQRKVEQAMRNAMKNDRARHSVSRISSNGLLEINRQRIKQSLRLRTHRPCPTCGGVGSIASLEFAAMSLIGRIEARAATGYLEGVRIALHPEVADAVQNNHRHDLSNLEAEFDLSVEVIAASNLHRTEERVEWKKRTKPRSAAAMAAAVTGVTASAITDTGRRRRRGRADVAAAVDEPRATGRAANDDDTPSRGSRRGRDASSTVAHRSRGGGGRWGDGGRAASAAPEVVAAAAVDAERAESRRRARATRSASAGGSGGGRWGDSGGARRTRTRAEATPAVDSDSDRVPAPVEPVVAAPVEETTVNGAADARWGGGRIHRRRDRTARDEPASQAAPAKPAARKTDASADEDAAPARRTRRRRDDDAPAPRAKRNGRAANKTDRDDGEPEPRTRRRAKEEGVRAKSSPGDDAGNRSRRRKRRKRGSGDDDSIGNVAPPTASASARGEVNGNRVPTSRKRRKRGGGGGGHRNLEQPPMAEPNPLDGLSDEQLDRMVNGNVDRPRRSKNAKGLPPSEPESVRYASPRAQYVSDDELPIGARNRRRWRWWAGDPQEEVVSDDDLTSDE